MTPKVANKFPKTTTKTEVALLGRGISRISARIASAMQTNNPDLAIASKTGKTTRFKGKCPSSQPIPIIRSGKGFFRRAKNNTSGRVARVLFVFS
jgi:hypothetical protein